MTEAQRKAQQAVQEAMDRRDNGGVTGHRAVKSSAVEVGPTGNDMTRRQMPSTQ